MIDKLLSSSCNTLYKNVLFSICFILIYIWCNKELCYFDKAYFTTHTSQFRRNIEFLISLQIKNCHSYSKSMTSKRAVINGFISLVTSFYFYMWSFSFSFESRTCYKCCWYLLIIVDFLDLLFILYHVLYDVCDKCMWKSIHRNSLIKG